MIAQRAARYNDKQRILTTGFLQKKIFPCLIELAPGGKTTLEQAKPDVEKCFYVISGQVRCSIGHPYVWRNTLWLIMAVFLQT
jgi:hypothetical protein